MKFVLPLALAFMAFSPVRAQSVQDQVAVLEKRRAAEVARATAGVNQNYLRDYETLLQRANILGDAQGAYLVRTVIGRLTPEPVAAGKADPVPDVKPLADVQSGPDAKPGADPVAVLTSNHWKEETQGDNGRKHFLPMAFLPGGEMKSRDHGWSGTWKLENNQLVVEINAYPGEYRKYALPVLMKNWPGVGGKSTLSGYPNVSAEDTEAFLHDAKKTTETAKPGPTEQPGYFGKPSS